MVVRVGVCILVLLTAGCAVESPHNRSYVSEGVREHTDYELGPELAPGGFSVPESVSLADGLSLDDAVALALWNNAQLQADLATLGFARADLIEANMLANPVFSLLFPVGPKLLEARLTYPIDTLWERPRRIAAAKLDAEGLAERLVEHGLGLIRDVQRSYVDLWLAQERARLAGEETQLQSERAQIARRRLEAGDISELATSAAHVELLRTMERTRSAAKDVTILRGRLQLLLGLVSIDSTFHILPPDVGAESVAPIDTLLETALVARPDLRAAELAIEAAGERLGWEQANILDFILWLDGKDKGERPLEIGPGFAVEIPILNQNNGRIARARAELEAAARQYEVTRQRIILQVHEAYTEYASAREDYDLWRGDVMGVLEEANQQVEKSFASGDVSYLRVLDAKTKVIEAQLHAAELTASLQRSVAQLNYCVGRRMTMVRSEATVK